MRNLPIALIAVTCLGFHAELARAADANDGIEVLKLRPNFYMIAGAGANVAVQIGEIGAVVVDTGDGSATPRIVEEIKKLTPLPIRYIINTSADPDHVGGNEKISAAGLSLIPQGQFGGVGNLVSNGGAAAILGTDNVMNRMSAPTGQKSPYPTAAQPSDSFSDEEKDTFLNGEAIQIFAQPAAHTDGDAMVFFRRSDVVVTGDIIDTTRFPVIDVAKGGSIAGEIAALQKLVDTAIPSVPIVSREEGTLIIPGHGRICDQLDVVEYRDMVTIIRDRIRDLMKQGLTLEQIKASSPARGYIHRYGSDAGPWTTNDFVEAVYRSMNEKPL